jgi:hypothetical protein
MASKPSRHGGAIRSLCRVLWRAGSHANLDGESVLRTRTPSLGNHCFVLGERIERNLYDLLELLIRAKYNRQRHELLERANLMTEFSRQ